MPVYRAFCNTLDGGADWGSEGKKKILHNQNRRQFLWEWLVTPGNKG